MTGVPIVGWLPEMRTTIDAANKEVNARCTFAPDLEWRGEENIWSFPFRGRGDCEDFALEKRRLLASVGIPRAAMTLAIVHHATQLYSHVVLLIETQGGTFVLDNLNDQIACWSEAHFYFEGRERTDGRWDWYEQSKWKFGQEPRY